MIEFKHAAAYPQPRLRVTATYPNPADGAPESVEVECSDPDIDLVHLCGVLLDRLTALREPDPITPLSHHPPDRERGEQPPVSVSYWPRSGGEVTSEAGP